MAKNGEMALAMLKNEAGYEDFGQPDIILLDLNLPNMSGHELLKIVKEDAGLKHIPVVILSSSNAEQDVLKSYNLHANSYIMKPINLEEYTEMAELINKFFFLLSLLPEQRSNPGEE